MFKTLFSCVALIALSGCGGGGSTGSAGSSAIPGQAQSASTATLPASSGTIGSGYLECDTAAQSAAGNHCNNYANFDGATSTFAFTAIAAMSSGAPIAQQTSGGSPMSFPNGALALVEAASDGTPIVSIAGGPWTDPGAAFSGSDGSYGHRVLVTCLRAGVATVQLMLVAGGSRTALPYATAAFASNEASVNCTASGSLTLQ